MSRCVYYTAATLDGFLADDQDSLAWLFVQDPGEKKSTNIEHFVAGVGAIVMGATTYQWLLRHLERTGDEWYYDAPCFVFTHRTDLPQAVPGIRFVTGRVEDRWDDIVTAACEGDVWMMGGGDLAGQFADQGYLDEIRLSIAPVTLGSGRPLFPRRYDLRLRHLERSGDFLVAWYDVRGPGHWEDPSV